MSVQNFHLLETLHQPNAALTKKQCCAVCGGKRKGNAKQEWCCLWHGSVPYRFLFADDAPINVANQEEFDERAAELEAKEPADNSTARSGQEDVEGPVVVLFDEKVVNEFPKLGQRLSNSDRKDRMADVLQRIRDAGNPSARPLGVLPENWTDLIDEFRRAFPNFLEFADLLRDQFSLSALGDRRINLPRVLFVGPPGIGKTEAANWLAERLSLPFRAVDFSTTQTSVTLSGLDEGYRNTREGVVFELLAYEKVANPIIVIDELDKANGDERFDPVSSLYGLLEPRSSRRFVDQSLRDLPLDASHVNWLATANEIAPIAAPILSRFTVVKIAAPNSLQTESIAQEIYARIRRGNHWGAHFPEVLSNSVIARLRTSSPRDIAGLMPRAFGAAAREGRRIIEEQDIHFPIVKEPFGFRG